MRITSENMLQMKLYTQYYQFTFRKFKNVETKTYKMKLVRAESLDQLRTERGKARMNMPYWVEFDGVMVFQFVGAHTDPLALETQIGHGCVWIEEKYVENVKGER